MHKAGHSTARDATLELSDFFSAAEARRDQWSRLLSCADAWNASEGKNDPARQSVLALFDQIGPLESFFAYPGPALMRSLQDLIDDGDSNAFAGAVRRVKSAIFSGSFRREASVWDIERNESEATLDERLPPGIGVGMTHRPYFELLVVSPQPTTSIHAQRELRKLRRTEDELIYEGVHANSFEDALVAIIINPALQAAIIYDGFQLRSRFGLPVLHEMLTRFTGDSGTGLPQDYGLSLSRIIKQIRPELDLYLVSERGVEKVASSPDAKYVRRVFYEIEELMEIHLSVIGGVMERYETPFFDNLKHYAARPVGTFHALPVARGKSIFKSNWIRDMGQFYGANLFLAESSATTGGLDSLLEPTGNIRKAQQMAARAFGADHVFFGTNGTSTSNKIVLQAICRPGDIVLIDRNCHKSHHYGLVLAGAQPLYVEAYPMVQYSMYGGVPLRTIKQALLRLKAEGKLDKARLVDLTNCTFDGHMYNCRRVMEECLAIKPDLIFLWDEAWFGFARFSAFHRRRTAMGAAAALEERYSSDAYRKEYEEFKSKAGDIDPNDPRMLDMHLMPDPEKVRVRVYQTNSTHKSMSALRQGSMMLVKDQDFAEVEEQFHEAFFTHTSTSPNQQIIASLDIARRQMELEGYELTLESTSLALDLRRQVNTHPVISKYFHIATPGEMVPKEYRASGVEDYGLPHGAPWNKVIEAWDEDEFALDPTRITVVTGTAGYDGTQFKNYIAEKYDVQINKTSRNSILVQTNINNTRSDIAHLLRVLSEISYEIDAKLKDGGKAAQDVFAARVKSLMTDVPDLPDFSRFHDSFRDNPKSETSEGHMREAFYTAYRAEDCEHVKLASKEIDDRLKSGPELVAATFVIPYPPGFPIMVPGQVILADTIEFMRKLDVKEIHGYTAELGLKLLKPQSLAKKKSK